MENFDDQFIESNAATKTSNTPPTFLLILIVLSGFSIGQGIFSTIIGLIKGPTDADTFSEQLNPLYQSIGELRGVGMDGMADSLNQLIDYLSYINNEIFMSQSLLTLLTYIVGAFALLSMWKLKKLGFHLYVLYSILPILIMYVLLPNGTVPKLMVYANLFTGVLFVILYSLNLKHLKN